MFTNLFRLRDWFILGPLGIAAIVLGFWGFLACGPLRPCHVVSVADALFRAVGLLRLNGNYEPGLDPWQLVIAQFALPAMAVLGGAKLLLVNLRRDMRVALAHRARNHVIVCGLGDTGRNVVEGLVEERRPVVAITLDADGANALACENLGVAVLKGDASQAGMLALAGMRRAEAVVMTTGSDAQNLEIGLRAGEMLEGQVAPHPVVLLSELRTDWLRDTLTGHRTAVLGRRSAEMQLFNIYTNSARALLHSAPFSRALLQHASRPHLLLAGFGSGGSEIAGQTIQSSFAAPGVRLSVTVFDEKAKAHENLFRLRSPGLSKLADFDFRTCTFNAENAASWSEIEKSLADLKAQMIVVALSSDEDSLHTALQFRSCLDRLGQLTTPVFVRLRQQHKLGEFMRQVESHPLLPDRLVSFGDLKQLTSPKMLLGYALDRLARAAHEAYLETIGPAEHSPASVPWEHLPERYKRSNRAFADHMPALLRAVGRSLVPGVADEQQFDAETTETLARGEHWRWCVEQWAADWSFAEQRDDVRRLHPLLRNWNEIPVDDQQRNRDLVRRIPAIARKAGFHISREQIVPLADCEQAHRCLVELPKGATPILLLDPLAAEQIETAKSLLASYPVRVRLVWRGAQALGQIQPRLAAAPGLIAALDGWITPPS